MTNTCFTSPRCGKAEGRTPIARAELEAFKDLPRHRATAGSPSAVQYGGTGMTNILFISSRYGEAEREMAQARVDMEARTLDLVPADDCPCKEGMFPGVSRRSLLAGGASLGGAMLASAASAQEGEAPPGANLNPVPDGPTRVQGRPALSENDYGSRSQFESEVRWRYPDPRPNTEGGDAQ